MTAPEVVVDLLHGLCNRTAAGIETQFGSLRRLEWRIKPRDVLDQAGPCPSVKSLRITGFANVQRRINEDLDESTGQQLTHSIAINTKRRNERSQHDQTCIDHQCRHLTSTTNILLPIMLGETQITIQTETQTISIEQIGMPTLGLQAALQRSGQSRLARSAEPREPDDARLLLLAQCP